MTETPAKIVLTLQNSARQEDWPSVNQMTKVTEVAVVIVPLVLYNVTTRYQLYRNTALSFHRLYIVATVGVFAEGAWAKVGLEIICVLLVGNCGA